MKRVADLFNNYLGANPFNDIQGRNFSDDKIIQEFQPISKFWTLFNNQHEVIVGTRGSGKTFLLKMMRRSMLRRIKHPNAEKIVASKEFLSLYVPMHLEFVRLFSDEKINTERKKELFLMMFNCFLAHSLVLEIQDLLISEVTDDDQKYLLTAKVCSYIDKIWFGVTKSNLYSFSALIDKINSLYYSIDPNGENLNNGPIVFKRQLCSPLLAIKDRLEYIFNLSSPTWIICIDEAEFLSEDIQKIINSVLRSDSNNIAIKIATLPFHHTTLDTTEQGVSIGEGDDFVYNIIDLHFESNDFIDLTNKLCQNRLNSLLSDSQHINELKDFLGTVGTDSLIDYYRLQFGEEAATEEEIETRIVNQFSPKKRRGSETYTNRKQAVYRKYYPILFVRDMYNESRKGNNTPGWYAGADVIRKVSQGNPRMFIQLMHSMFEKARENILEPKVQHRVVIQFAEKICNATKSLQAQGPIINFFLDKISQKLHDRIHGEYIVDYGTSFILSFSNKYDLKNSMDWLKLAIAHSRLIVEDEVKKSKNLEDGTRYMLSNSYAVQYWLPMRKGESLKINNSDICFSKDKIEVVISTCKRSENQVPQQLSLFNDEEGNS